MRRSPTIRRRAEGYAEYVLILSLMMICTISTFLTSGSEGMRTLARSRQLCTMEKGNSKECDNLVRRPTDGATPPGTPSSDPAKPADPNTPPAVVDPNAKSPPVDPNLPAVDPSAPIPPPIDPSALPPPTWEPAPAPPWYSQLLFGPDGPNSTTDEILLAFFGFFGGLF